MGGSLRTDRASAGLAGRLSEHVRAEGEIALEKVKNPSGLPGSTAEDASFRVGFSHRPGTGKGRLTGLSPHR